MTIFTGGQLCAHHGARDADAHTRIGCAANNVEQGGLAYIHLAHAQAVCIGMLLGTFNFTHDHAGKRWCYRLKFFNLQARHGEGFGELFGSEGWVTKLTQPRFRKLHGLLGLKLTQEANVAIEEQAQIIDAISEHGETVGAHAKGKANEFFWVEAHVANHIRVNLARTGHF